MRLKSFFKSDVGKIQPVPAIALALSKSFYAILGEHRAWVLGPQALRRTDQPLHSPPVQTSGRTLYRDVIGCKIP